MAKAGLKALPASHPLLWTYLPGTVWVGSGYADAVPGLEHWGN